MKPIYQILGVAIFLLGTPRPTFTEAKAAMDYPKNQVRTYMQYTLPVDPVRIVTIPDMDISYALGTCLVTWSPLKQIREGVAKSWKFIGEKTIRFALQDHLKWSDGTSIKSNDVKRSFDRALNAFPGSLRSLREALDHFEIPNDHEIDFVLKVEAASSNLLGKLTEPNYSVLNVLPDGKSLDLKKSSGAFSLISANEKEIVLKKNPNYVFLNEKSAESIIIRKFKSGDSATRILLSEQWPNLMETSSMIEAKDLDRLKAQKFTIWSRPLDKVGLLRLSHKKLNEDKINLIRFLGQSLSREILLKNVTGQESTRQLFPKGYVLHDPKFSIEDSEKVPLPETYKKHPVQILISPDRFDEKLESNLDQAIEKATGRRPEFKRVPINEISKWRDEGNFDFYAGTVGLADPDAEGVMSYYFEGEYSVVPAFGGKYVKRLDHARSEKDGVKRVEEMRSIIRDAIQDGGLLPLFHYSTVGIGRDELDFSEIPSTDESVTFSKIRFKKKN